MERPDLDAIERKSSIFSSQRVTLEEFLSVITYARRLEVTLVAHMSERNAWARQMADLHDAVEDADKIADGALAQYREIDMERTTMAVRIDELEQGNLMLQIDNATAWSEVSNLAEQLAEKE